jgi:hypothetical protein
MNMKMVLSVLAGILAMAQTLSAQHANIQGKILDATDNTPVISANVLLLKQDSTYISGINSDLDGMFEMKNIPAGNYLLSVSYLGYEIVYAGVNHKGEGSFVEIPLKQSSFTLNEVTIA